ncbi:MAG TPA: amino acid permease [Candidatus Angelobacter sp.]
MPNKEPDTSSTPLARKLGLFDSTMLVMGGTIGGGIFVNPYVVAGHVHTPALVLGAWIAGGGIALTGALIYAEIANRLPRVGGQYAYLRESYHPLIAFLYGWVLLLVIQTGGMAVVTSIFSRYLMVLTGWHAPEWLVGVITLTIFTLANCLGVKSGSNVQSALMVLRIAAIALLVFAGALLVRGEHLVWRPLVGQSISPDLLSSFGAAMVPVLFAYGGWQTGCFVAGEMKKPERDLPRALVLGVIGVAALYTAVNLIYLRGLGVAGLAQTRTPASAVMEIALGNAGVIIIALGIALSTLGFLSQSVLTAPRVYFAMAEDGVFFRQLAQVHAKTQVPVLAIIVQSVWTVVILISGRYEQILNYVTSMDWIFFGLSASCLFILRHRHPQAAQVPGSPARATLAFARDGVEVRMPGHPITTGLFCLACWAVAGNAIYRYPRDTLFGLAILASGVPIYYLWKRILPA